MATKDAAFTTAERAPLVLLVGEEDDEDELEDPVLVELVVPMVGVAF